MNNIQKLYLSKEDYYQLIDELICKIKDKKCKYDVVVGIMNDGTEIAERVSQELELPLELVEISWYHNNIKQYRPIVDKHFRWKPNILLIDFEINTGSTIKTFQECFGKASVGVLYYNPNAQEYKLIPDYWARLMPKKDKMV
jgi:hypoxanthine phosphoribosyltransferase